MAPTSGLVRIAGLSGALAIGLYSYSLNMVLSLTKNLTIPGLGAYGAHSLAGQDVAQDRLKAFEVANRLGILLHPPKIPNCYSFRYHLIHSVALLALPLASKPRLSGSLMLGGMALFCGTCYYHALTGALPLRRT